MASLVGRERKARPGTEPGTSPVHERCSSLTAGLPNRFVEESSTPTITYFRQRFDNLFREHRVSLRLEWNTVDLWGDGR